MVVDGVEIMRMIRDNEFKDGDEIEEDRRTFKYNADIESFFEVDGDENHIMYYYTDKEFASAEFEILSKEDEPIDIQAIKNIMFKREVNDNEMYLGDKIDELIKAVKQLDKNKENK